MKATALPIVLLVFRAYRELIHFDFLLAGRNFAALRDKVRKFPVKDRSPDPRTVQAICRAIDIACICYWKQVLCLQRSAATACLLKRNGVPAVFVLGAQQLPFKAHAWVEVGGRVVNDKPYTAEIYGELDRC
jgi:hypothetical protein